MSVLGLRRFGDRRRPPGRPASASESTAVASRLRVWRANVELWATGPLPPSFDVAAVAVAVVAAIVHKRRSRILLRYLHIVPVSEEGGAAMIVPVAPSGHRSWVPLAACRVCIGRPRFFGGYSAYIAQLAFLDVANALVAGCRDHCLSWMLRCFNRQYEFPPHFHHMYMLSRCLSRPQGEFAESW